jgi:hypothetical protein
MNKTAIEVIKKTLGTDAEGNVSFRTREGRGSGCGVKIPVSQIPELLKLLNDVQQQTQQTVTTTEVTE